MIDFAITIENLNTDDEYTDLFSAESIHDAVDMALQYYSLKFSMAEDKIKIKGIKTINENG